jgi:ketosteroid isomerase-like protein
MSLENVEIVRGSFAEWAETGQLAFRLLDPKVEWHTRIDLPDSSVYCGHDGVAKLAQDWDTVFEDPRFEVEDYIDRGDCVVVPMVLRGRIRGSEQDLEMPETWVLKLCDGIVVEVHEYCTLAEALDAAPVES